MKLIITLAAVFIILSSSAQTKNVNYTNASGYYDKNDYANALIQINLALRADSTNKDFLLLKGNTLEKVKEYQAAFDTYTKSIGLYPEDATALNQRGLLLNIVQEFESSIQDFTTALNLHNDDSTKLTLYLNRGAAKINIRDFQGAYADFIYAYKIDSLSIGVLNNLASVCDEVGKGDLTLGYLYKILQIDSTFVGAYGNIGFKYQEMGDYKTAIKYFDKILTIDANEPLAFSNRAYNKYKLGDLDDALIDINKSIVLYPANSYAYRIRALIYLAKKQNKLACEDLDKALGLGFTKMYGEEVEALKLKNCH